MAAGTTVAAQEQEGPQEDLGEQCSRQWDEHSKCKGPEVGTGFCVQSTVRGLRGSLGVLIASRAEQGWGPPVFFRPQGRLLREALPDHPAPGTPSPPPAFLALQPSHHLTASYLFVSCFSPTGLAVP